MKDPTPDSPRRHVEPIDALCAFARLYGYVRFFHPSDEAAAVDWERLAVLGARRVQDLEDRHALRRALEALFLPIAPTVQVWCEGQDAPPPLVGELENAGDLATVAWQHVGCGWQQRGETYRSLRTGRGASFPVTVELEGPACLFRRLPAAELRGRRLRLRARVRTKIDGNDGHILLTLQELRRAGAELGFPGWQACVVSPTPEVHERLHEVSAEASEVVFGCMVLGRSSARLADFEVAVEHGDTWHALELPNASFDDGLAGWEHRLDGYDQRIEEGVLSLDRCLEHVDRLFEACPHVGDATERPIGAGLVARVPLALYGTAERTLGEPRVPLEPLLEDLMSIDDETRADPTRREVRFAAITIAWNVLQHFYPYFDVVDVDWPSVLRRTLERARDDEDDRAFQWTLRHMLAPLEDGHAGVLAEGGFGMDCVPVRFAWAGERIAVLYSEHPAVHPGDVVVAVDGRPIADVVAETEAWVSGSPQWRRIAAAWMLARGTKGGEAVFTLDRFGASVEVPLRYELDQPIRAPERRTVETLEDGVMVVDLGCTGWDVLETRLDELAGAPGVVFDLRSYPKGNHEILCHLLSEPLAPNDRFFVSHRIEPDGGEPAAWEGSGWEFEPQAPRLRGRVAFLTGPGAISYAESFLSYVEDFRLAELVGEASAGTNGNMHKFSVPGGYRIGWTGMRVLKRDGSQHHGIGIQPTVRVTSTPEGFRDGRDEVLEAALEIVRRPSAPPEPAVRGKP